MNVLVIAYIAAAFICFESAVTIYRLNRAAKINRIYTALAVSLTIYSIVMVQFLISPDEESCWLWYRLFAFFACAFSILGVRYFLELTGIKRVTQNRFFILALYALAVFVFVISVFVSPLIYGFVRVSWGWDLVLKHTIWSVCFYSFLMSCYIVCALLALRWFITAETDRQKKQARVVIVLGLIGVTGMLHFYFSGLHDQSAMVKQVHFYNIFCLVLFVIGIRYAIIKYKLMTLVPANTAQELFAGMNNALFITDTKGGIIFTNEHALKIMKQRKSDPVGKVIYSLFHGGESLKLQIDEIISGQIINQTITTFLISGQNNVSGIDLNPHCIRNEIGECIGFMILARENKGLVNIQERFHLTNRELEVLLLLNDGLSAREISDECEISLLTTKTHIHNIYRKTELRNRVEISNLLNKNT